VVKTVGKSFFMKDANSSASQGEKNDGRRGWIVPRGQGIGAATTTERRSATIVRSQICMEVSFRE